MEWINWYGFVFMLVLMTPNLIFAVKCKEGFQNRWSNRIIETLEQIGRFGCFGFMILIIPDCGFGFSSEAVLGFYCILDAALLLAYSILWICCFHRESLFRALALSIIPSVLFLVSGVLSHYVPLLISALLFAPCHITFSYKNAILHSKNN